jgi:molybdopterin synthase catalytic subunit
MRVQVIPFGVLKDWLGSSVKTLELPDGACVAVLLESLRTRLPASAGAGILSSIAVSVNAEYAQAAHILHDGDEVGLLPPVSGGTSRGNRLEIRERILDAVANDYEEFDMVVAEVSKRKNNVAELPDAAQIEQALIELIAEKDVQAFEFIEGSSRYVPVEAKLETIRDRWFYVTEQGKRKLSEPDNYVALTRERIEAEKIVAEAKSGEDGAVVVFDGIVRNHTRGRLTLHLDYEAYEEMALKQMRELGLKARERFGVRQVTMVHRLGRLEIGETSVLIVVASAHRSAAFEACRWLIDTLKQTVPIWKKETFADGAVWAPGDPFPKEIAIEPHLQSAEAPHEN